MEQGEIDSFAQGPSLQRLREVLTRPIPKPIWWVIPGEEPKRLDHTQACRSCEFVRQSHKNRQTCQRRFLEALEEARKKGKPLQFICPIQRYALCLPVIQNRQVQGYLALCHSTSSISQETIQLAELTVETALKEAGLSQELKNLSEAIQPRCVALSTIHTIHRLISSTLNLEELLPRVARLCCQVLRVQSCIIWLLDREKGLLFPRAVIHLQKEKGAFPHPCRVGEGIPGEVALSCEVQLKGRRMVVPLVEEECIGVIQVDRDAQGQPFSTLDQEILMTLAEQAVVAIRNAQMYETQERVTWGTIKSLSAILDGMDTYSPQGASHGQILADVSLGIAQKIGLSSAQQRPLHYAALLHDAGRVGIPQEILRKPSKLEPAEFAKVKEHPTKGASILEPLEILEPAIPIILHHHERYDGTGYPKGLKKDSIPLGARILAVANAFEAMICERPYRPSMSIAQAAREIASHAGTQFDPKVVHAFLGLVRSGRLESVVRSRKDSPRSTDRNRGRAPVA